MYPKWVTDLLEKHNDLESEYKLLQYLILFIKKLITPKEQVSKWKIFFFFSFFLMKAVRGGIRANISQASEYINGNLTFFFF